jgi:hypothetical protein
MLQEKSLIDFLPYDSEVKILESSLKKRILSFILVVLDELVETIQDFYFKKKMTAFDPHVGEGLCQIRACQLLDIYYQTKDEPLFEDSALKIKKFNEIKKNIKYLLECDDVNNQSDENYTVGSYLKQLQLHIPISHNLFFLMLSHFLTKFRKINELENTMINYPKLISYLKLSKNISRRIIHQYQKQLSEYSYYYVEHKALLYKVINIDFLRMLQRFDDDGRYTLPCYIVTKVLLADLKAKKTNILFVVRHDKSLKFTTLLYSYDIRLEQYVFCTNPTPVVLNSPCFVLHGVSNQECDEETNRYVDKFNNIGANTVITLDSAAHPQHSGKKLSELKWNPFLPIIRGNNKELAALAMNIEEQFHSMKAMSERVGCNSINPKLIFIRHIFCDHLDKQLQYVSNHYFYSTMPEEEQATV